MFDEIGWIFRDHSWASNWWFEQWEKQKERHERAASLELKSTHATIARLMLSSAMDEKKIKQMSLFPASTKPKMSAGTR